MITGEIRNQIDRIWDAFWAGGISNPLEVIEQITYLLFLKRLDDLFTDVTPHGPNGPFNRGEVDEVLATLASVRATAVAA